MDNENIYQHNKWEFNKEVSDVFDKHVRQSIPMYEEFQKSVIKLSEFFIKNGDCVYDLGCATGETTYLLNQKNDKTCKKNIRFVLIDNSQSMINKARQKCSQYNNIEYIVDNIENVKFSKTNFVISLFTLQFLDQESRFNVIKNIYNGLNKGGALILAEKSYSNNIVINDYFTQMYHDFKEDNDLTPIEIREKDKSLRSVLVPLTINENIEMLNESGFNKVDIFMKALNFTGFIAIK